MSVEIGRVEIEHTLNKRCNLSYYTRHIFFILVTFCYLFLTVFSYLASWPRAMPMTCVSHHRHLFPRFAPAAKFLGVKFFSDTFPAFVVTSRQFPRNLGTSDTFSHVKHQRKVFPPLCANKWINSLVICVSLVWLDFLSLWIHSKLSTTATFGAKKVSFVERWLS